MTQPAWVPSFPPFDDVFTVEGDYRNVSAPVATGNSNQSAVQIITAFVDLIPRVPVGFMFYKEWQVQGQNAVQSLGFPAVPPAGTTFDVTFNGSAATAQLAYDATPAQVQSALEGLSTIGAGNVLVYADPTIHGWDVEFVGALANAVQPLMVAATSGTTSLIEVGTIQDGLAPATRNTGFAFDVYYPARIWTNGQLSSINQADSAGITLPANTAYMTQQLGSDLYYDIRFRNAVYGNNQNALLQNFAIKAAAVGDTVVLTDPALERFPYAAASNVPILS